MKGEPAKFKTILDKRKTLEVQIIYTQINRDQNNIPQLKTFQYNVDTSRYFYPASTVKFPMVLLALEKVNTLNIPKLNRYTPMYHDSVYSGQRWSRMDTTAEGVESFDQFDLMKSLNVTLVQGYIYSKPIPNDQFVQRLNEGDWIIKPSGPAFQRQDRQSMFRRIGAIHDNHYYPVVLPKPLKPKPKPLKPWRGPPRLRPAPPSWR